MKYNMTEVWETLRTARDAFCDKADDDEQIASGDMGNMYSFIIDLEDGYIELTEENIKTALDMAEIMINECRQEEKI